MHFFRAIELYEEAHRQRTCRVPATSDLMVATNGLSGARELVRIDTLCVLAATEDDRLEQV